MRPFFKIDLSNLTQLEHLTYLLTYILGFSENTKLFFYDFLTRFEITLIKSHRLSDNSKNIVPINFIFGIHIFWAKALDAFENQNRRSLNMRIMTYNIFNDARRRAYFAVLRLLLFTYGSGSQDSTCDCLYRYY